MHRKYLLFAIVGRSQFAVVDYSRLRHRDYAWWHDCDFCFIGEKCDRSTRYEPLAGTAAGAGDGDRHSFFLQSFFSAAAAFDTHADYRLAEYADHRFPAQREVHKRL